MPSVMSVSVHCMRLAASFDTLTEDPQFLFPPIVFLPPPFILLDLFFLFAQ